MNLFGKLKQNMASFISGKKNEYPSSLDNQSVSNELPDCDKPINTTGKYKQEWVALLTPREHDLYLLLLEGFTLKESAKQLSIKYSTANTHMTGIYRKLGVNSRAELIINYRHFNGTN